MSSQPMPQSRQSVSEQLRHQSIALGLLALSILAGAVAYAGTFIACLALYVQVYGHSMAYGQGNISGLAAFIAPSLSFLTATTVASAGLVRARTRFITIIVILAALVLWVVAIISPGFLDSL